MTGFRIELLSRTVSDLVAEFHGELGIAMRRLDAAIADGGFATEDSLSQARLQAALDSIRDADRAVCAIRQKLSAGVVA